MPARHCINWIKLNDLDDRRRTKNNNLARNELLKKEIDYLLLEKLEARAGVEPA